MQESMRTVFATILFLSLLASQAIANVTDFTWSPGDPVMGEMVAYTAIDDHSRPVTSYL